MPTLKLKKAEIKVPKSLVIRMADRMHRFGNTARRENYVARAQKRLEAGHHADELLEAGDTARSASVTSRRD